MLTRSCEDSVEERVTVRAKDFSTDSPQGVVADLIVGSCLADLMLPQHFFTKMISPITGPPSGSLLYILITFRAPALIASGGRPGHRFRHPQ